MTYQVDGDIIRIVPKVSERPIPKDELRAETVKKALDTITYCIRSICFSESGLAKALSDKFVEARVVDDAFGKSEENVLTESGMQRFGYLIASDIIDNQQPVRVASRGDRAEGVIPESGAFFHNGLPCGESGLVGDVVVGGVRLLRASATTNEVASLIFRDYDSNEFVPIDLDKVEGDPPNNGDFLVVTPERQPGIYVFYHLDIERIRPEDKEFFHHRQYRLDQLHEHELGYFLHMPRSLQRDRAPRVSPEDPYSAPTW